MMFILVSYIDYSDHRQVSVSTFEDAKALIGLLQDHDKVIAFRLDGATIEDLGLSKPNFTKYREDGYTKEDFDLHYNGNTT